MGVVENYIWLLFVFHAFLTVC